MLNAIKPNPFTPAEKVNLPRIFFRLIRAECARIFRSPEEFFPPLGYFLFSLCLFSLLSSEANEKGRHFYIAMICVCFFSAIFPAAEGIFSKDLRSGRTDLYLFSPIGLAGVFVAKCAALWITACFPMILLIGFFELFANAHTNFFLPITAGVAAASVCLAFFSMFGAIVTSAIGRGGSLIFILILPLTAPAMIFSAGAGSAENFTVFAEAVRLGCGFSLFSALITGFAARYLLKKSIEEA